MKNIEVELRSYITKDKYESLLKFFKTESMMFTSDEQETHYFDAPFDIRLQQNLHSSKIWMKKGRMNAPQREELEVHFARDDFDSLGKMFQMMGYGVKVKWFRRRHTFAWKGFEVCLDDNKGFGHVLEIEKKSDSGGKEKALAEIKKAFRELNVPVTPQEEQAKRYRHYVRNWEKLTR